MNQGWPSVDYDGVARDVRHAARAHPGAGQAGGPARPARAPAPARGAAADRPRLGDRPLPAPDGSGALVAALDLRTHEAVVEHSGGQAERVALTPDRPVGSRDPRGAGRGAPLGGPVEIDPTPQEVAWSVPLDEDHEHATYDGARSRDYFAAATQAALVLAAYRAPYRGRSTPVNAWWGSFDLAVSLFSGRTVEPPSSAGFIMRNAGDAQQVEVGWWPGDGRYGKAAFYAYAHPAPEGFGEPNCPGRRPLGRRLGEYVLDWDDVPLEFPTHTTWRSRSPARCSSMPAWCVTGIPRSRQVPKEHPRRSVDAGSPAIPAAVRARGGDQRGAPARCGRGDDPRARARPRVFVQIDEEGVAAGGGGPPRACS